MSEIGDVKRRLPILGNWTTPFDLSVAPIVIFLAVIPNTAVELHYADSTRAVLLWIFIKVAALSVWFTPLYGLKAIFSKLGIRKINLFTGGAIGAVIGACAGMFVYYCADYFNLHVYGETLSRRTVSTAIIGFTGMPMVLVLSASVTKIREVAFGKEGSPQSLIRQNFRKTGYYQSYLRKSSNLIESELSMLAQSLSQEISLLASDERSALVNAEKIVEKLGTQDFRSLSNRIDKLSQVPSRKRNFGLRWLTFRNYFFVTLSAVYRDMKTNPLNPKVYTYVIAVCTLSIQLRNNESIENIIIFTCVTGLITFVLQSLNVLYWKQSDKQFFLVSQLILLTNIGLIYVARDYSRLLGTDLALRGQTGRFVILLLLLFSATYILGHLGNAGVTATVDLFRVREFSRATERIEEEMLQDQTRLIGRKWAVHIHGKIQTRISATALSIKQAVAQNNSSALMRAVSSIQSTLAEPSAGMISIDRNLKSEIEARCAPWQGLVDYKLTIEPKMESLTGSQVRVAGDVIEEVISNAARHGGATKLEIKFSTNKRGDIDVLVEDNSVTPPPEIFQRGVGLGATIFTAASFGRWSLERDKNRGITVFKIKISPDANFDFEN